MRRAVAAAIMLAAAGAALALAVTRRGDDGARCGAGFEARGSRCFPVGGEAGACPAPLAATDHGCDAPDVRVLVPAASVAVGPSDWEAEGRVAARSIRVAAFRIDAFEVTRGRWYGKDWRRGPADDQARAMSGVTRSDAEAFCAGRGGRLPTEDEWIVAAVSAMNPPRRYPWGDTGAVCRRAAWGLATGPCARGANGPDTVGAHPDGDSPLGVHDLAGNVAEWVSGHVAGDVLSPEAPRTGTSASPRAAPGRTPSPATSASGPASKLDPAARDPRVGFRCAYPP